MYVQIRPGDLVVCRQRWHVKAHVLGIVLGCGFIDSRALVLWMASDASISFEQHIYESLLRIDESNIDDVKKRCALGG